MYFVLHHSGHYRCQQVHRISPTVLSSPGGVGERRRITFEPTKSQFMSVSTHRAQWPIPDLTFDGTTLQHSDSIKLLGVTFDTHLSYGNHLRAIALQANQRIGFFRKASNVLNRQGRMATDKGFIRPLLEYAP